MDIKQEMESLYARQEDVWKVNKGDKVKRNELKLSLLKSFRRFEKGLDLCCGEGTITHRLPCGELTGIDVSEIAIERARKKYPHIKWVAQNINDVDIKSISPGLVSWLDSNIYFNLQEKHKLLKQISEHFSVLLYSARLVGKRFKDYRKGCELDSVFAVDDLIHQYFPHIRSQVAELDFFTYRGHTPLVHMKKCIFSAIVLILTKFSKDKYTSRCNIVNKAIHVPVIRTFAAPLVQQYAVVGFYKE